MSETLKILRLEADNVMRLRAIEISPNGEAVVVIGGRNRQGKTSVLRSIEMALGGAGTMPPKPVREGEEEGHVVIDFGSIVVRRTFSADGKTALRVESQDGARYSSPQKMLDELVGKLSFDPLEFSRMDQRKQYDLLCQLVGLDLAAFERKRAGFFDERTGVNRTAKQLEGQLTGMPHHKDAPGAEVSVASLSEELKAAHEARDRSATADRAASATANAVVKATNIITQSESDIAERRARIEELREEIEEQQARIEAHERDIVSARGFIDGEGKRAKDEADAAAIAAADAVPDIEAIHARLRNAEELNAKVRANAARAAVAKRLEAERERADALTRDIEAVDSTKRDAIEAAQFPVPGLSVGDDGVTFNGLPFEQASGAEQLRVSCAIGLALNPKLRVLLIRDGSLLDEDGLALLAQIAAEADAQVWLERVSKDAAGCTVMIEDGNVVAPAREQPEQEQAHG